MSERQGTFNGFIGETEQKNDYPTSYLPQPSRPVHITKIKIENFKRIENAEIFLPKFAVLTGVNNSGKSTILQAIWAAFECFRLCVNRDVDRDLWKISKSGRAIAEFDFIMANQASDIWFERKTRMKGNILSPISIRVELSNGFFFKALLNNIFGGINVKIEDWNKTMGKVAIKEALALEPMLIPGHVEIGSHEEYRVPAQIHKFALTGQLSAIIRNILLTLSNQPTDAKPTPEMCYTFEFVTNAIKRHFELELGKVEFDPIRDLEIRTSYTEHLGEESYDLDIVSAGSGLHQILKLAAFIAWRKAKIVLLDEPDAHLHTSLQARLSSFLQELAEKFSIQIILATHSKDLICRTSTESIIPVDLTKTELKPIKGMDHLLLEYQRLGEISNMDIALLYQTRRCLFVEGNTELKLLPQIAAQLDYDIFAGHDQVVIFKYEGVDNISKVIALVELFEQMIGAKLSWFVLRDRDSSTQRMVEKFQAEAENKGIKNFYIWERYSIENYLIQPTLLQTAVQGKTNQAESITLGDINSILSDVCKEVKDKVQPTFITEAQNFYANTKLADPEYEKNRQIAAGEVLEYLKKASTLDDMIAILPGATVFGRFVKALQENYGINISFNTVVNHLNRENAPPELLEFFEKVRTSN